MAALAGVTPKTISEWLRGRGPLHPDHARAQIESALAGTLPASPAPARAEGEEPDDMGAIALEAYQLGAKLAVLRLHDRESYDEVLRVLTRELQRAGLDHVRTNHLDPIAAATQPVIRVMRSAIRRERRRVAQQMGDTAQE